MRGASAFLILIALAALGAPAYAEIHVEIGPTQLEVDPLQVFDLELRVPAAADSFNAYETKIGYDPSVLTFIQLSPISLQEGALMKNACPSRFHQFTRPNPDTLKITHALLCAGKKVAGPGVLYKLRFQAADVNAVTHVRIGSIVFADAGVNVLPVLTEDARITIGTVTGIGDDPGAGARPGLALSPNPFRHATTVHLRGVATGSARVGVHDLMGRRIGVLFDGVLQEGEERLVPWDGRDERGTPVAPGVYWIRADGPGWHESRRAVRLP